ncbi:MULTISPECIES: porin [unclassified Paludibacterium]|uniref:porin n=1 Tax=unclassified Paludibacterium TaxID=2618429 RepID=UPI001C048C5F|nr:porin [Paludibacterium sp. B53371]BEV70949.1 trimeric porin PorB [Paludibacterium sp. THUN1379]
MQKKIIALALAGAFITPLAMADVTIYGFISAAVEGASASNSNSNATYPGRARVQDQNSRIGFKGTEDLGNGLKTIWQVESSLKNFDQGGTNDKGEQATFATRNTFVGLSDSTLGTVRLGYYDSAYKRFTNVGANIMADTTADIMGSSSIAGRGEARLKNSIHYETPVWSGFQAGLSYGFDESTTQNPSTNTGRWSLGASYTNGGLKVGAAYDRQSDTSTKALTSTSGFSASTRTAGVNTTFWRLASSYKFDFGTMVAANYESASYGNIAGAGSSNLSQKDWTLAVSQTFGNATVALSYTKLGGLSNVSSTNSGDWGANQWVLGGTYNLSKQTQILAYATRLKNEANQNVNFANNAIYTSGVGSSTAALAAGNTLKAIGLGMKYSF